MKGAPLRIGLHENQKHLGTNGGEGEAASKYTEAVTKLVPGEVVAAYLAGKALLQAPSPPLSAIWWVAWTVFCLVCVLGWRAWMTSDKAAGVPVEWSAVVVSMLAFSVWVYSFGDVFEIFDLWNKVGSGLILIGWTLVSPLLLFWLKKIFRE
jgi:hypothetical protein